MTAAYAQVIVDVRPAHLDRPFDYLVPDGWEVGVGQRVRVPFSGRRCDGWVVGTSSDTEAERALPLARVQGTLRWFDAADLRLYRWVADRWAGTLADVLRHALPKRVAEVEREHADDSSRAGDGAAWGRAGATPSTATDAALWESYDAEGLLEAAEGRGAPGSFWLRPLPGDEVACGVDLVERTLAAGRAAVVLAPDPSSPLLEAARAVGGTAAADLRSGVSDRARYRAFLAARSGRARVVVGERGAVFAPVRDLGLLLVDDEASPAYKERRSPRHHAREVALARARMAGSTAVLCGDVPSAGLWRFLGDGHVAAVRAHRAVERQRAPRVEVVDLAGSRTRLSPPAHRAVAGAVEARRATVVLAARGGDGAALACQRCRQRLACPVCGGSIRRRRDSEAVECPSCGWEGPRATCSCGSTQASPLAAGAGRLATELGRAFPSAEVARMEGFDAPGPERMPAIGVMTRGSVVTRPRWLAGRRAAVLVIPDADAMRGRPALEAAEDALRLWMAAARGAERVVLQTHDPRDAAVQALVRWDPDGFWEREAVWRASLGFPPARSLVRVKAPAEHAAAVGAALREALGVTAAGEAAVGGAGQTTVEAAGEVAGEAAVTGAGQTAGEAAVEVLGPDPEGAVLVKTADLRGTLKALRPLREGWARSGRRVRVDVDPVPAG